MKNRLTEAANRFLGEEDLGEPSTIDFQQEFFNTGLSVEKGLTEDQVDSDQLIEGMKVEMEHTTNEDIAKKIALDHLAENPKYYDYLKEMEEKMEKSSDDKPEEGSVPDNAVDIDMEEPSEEDEE